MRITRRSFLAAGAAIATGLGGTHAARSANRFTRSARRPLRIPPLLDARTPGQAIALSAQEGMEEFFPGSLSETFGYNGSYLGPTLRMHRGDDVQVTVANLLAEATTVHWHGLIVPAQLDGGPHQLIAPGATWRPVLPVRQPAATLFYHSHVHGETARQVYLGLAGVLIVADDVEAALDLPSEYGVDDIPLVLQDRQFANGRLVLPSGMMTLMEGSRGDTLLVNGTADAFVRVPSRRIRLRLVNGSNARTYRLSFDDGRAFHWIATDGGLLEAPVEMRALTLAPGQRAEILVDFSAGGSATLETAADFNLPMMGMMGRPRDSLGARRQPLLAFEAGAPGVSPVPIPAGLAVREPADPSQAVKRRRFVLDMGMGGMGARGMAGGAMRGGGMMGRRMMGGGMGMGMGMGINGRAFDMARIDERVRLGDTEIWEVSAETMAHPFHVHGVHFEVLSRGGRRPDILDQGLRDTVLVQEPVELLVRFTQPAVEAPFMYHCHILEHEDNGMMGQYATQ
jgi:FtsP/CotA-like multicopper oxidase with cupredoxin domain